VSEGCTLCRVCLKGVRGAGCVWGCTWCRVCLKGVRGAGCVWGVRGAGARLVRVHRGRVHGALDDMSVSTPRTMPAAATD